MKKRNKYSHLFFLAVSFFIAQIGYAQKEVDSILTIAKNQIYENPDEAISLASEALQTSTITTRNKINALLTISTAYSSKRDYESASDYVGQVENLIPEMDDGLQKINILNRIAAHYQELQIYDKAMEYLDKASDLIVKYPSQSSVQSYLGYNSIVRGFIYREQTNCDIALKYFDKAIAAFSNSIPRKPFVDGNLSICYYNKGNCLLSLDEIEKAKESYRESIRYAKVINAKSLIAFAEKGLAEAETANGNYTESIALLTDALETSNGVGDRILNRGIYEDLAGNYLVLSDWDNYTRFENKYKAIKKEIKSSERKTINQSLINLTQNKAKEIKELRKYYSPILIAFIILNILAISILIRTILIWEKKLKQLENKLKT